MSSFAALKAQREARRKPLSGVGRAAAALTSKPEPNAAEVEAPTRNRSGDTINSSLTGPEPASDAACSSTDFTKKNDNKVRVEGFHRLEQNPDVALRISSLSGRGLFYLPQNGSSSTRPGDILLAVQPQVAVLSSPLLSLRCSGCFSDPSTSASSSKPIYAGGLQRCSACKWVKYCSAQCQKKDWNAHKQECKALCAMQSLRSQRVEHSVKGKKRVKEQLSEEEEMEQETGQELVTGAVTATIRALARWIWFRKRARALQEGIGSHAFELQSIRDRLPSERCEDFGQIAIRLAQYITASARLKASVEGALTFSEAEALRGLGIGSAAELLDVVIGFSTNSFALTDSDLTSVGICLDARMAMVNHSCEPNAAVVFPFGGSGERIMHLIALKNIEPNEEILISYVDTADSFDDRQKQLQDRYCFECRCTLCRKTVKAKEAKTEDRVKRWIDPREAVWCLKRCGGWLNASSNVAVCNKCRSQQVTSQQDVQAVRLQAKEVLVDATRLLESGQSEEAWTRCAPLIRDMVEKYAPSFQPLFSLLRLASTALIESGSKSLPSVDQDQVQDRDAVVQRHRGAIQSTRYCFEEAMRIQMLVVAGCQASFTPIYSQGHPARAVALATLAKLALAQFEQPNTEAKNVGTDAVAESILKNPPTVPAALRLQFAKQVLIQAIQELDIGFGRENDGGKVGREKRQELEEVDREIALLAQTGQIAM